MTPAEQSKVLALLDKVDPSKCGPQTMQEHAVEAKRLLEKYGFEGQTVGPDVLDELHEKLGALNEKFDRLGGQLAAIEMALKGDGERGARGRRASA